MRIAFFSAKPYDIQSFDLANQDRHEIAYLPPRLTHETAPLANGHDAVCAFVNDALDGMVLRTLHESGVRAVALRCAGFNNVDLEAARELGLPVVRVPAYSPHAVAEHTLALLLCLNRKIHRANNRVREGNFALEGLLGFDLYGKTVGVIGTGKIGLCVIRILQGFGCQVLAYDPFPSPEALASGATFGSIDRLLAESDVLTLHCPLTPETRHLVNADAITKMKRGAMLLNTSRGALLDTPAVIEGLKSGHIGSLAVDVYEEEADLFFEDRSGEAVMDDVFARLLTFPNVLVTGHQAFFTQEALAQIAETTLGNLDQLERCETCPNAVV